MQRIKDVWYLFWPVLVLDGIAILLSVVDYLVYNRFPAGLLFSIAILNVIGLVSFFLITRKTK